MTRDQEAFSAGFIAGMARAAHMAQPRNFSPAPNLESARALFEASGGLGAFMGMAIKRDPSLEPDEMRIDTRQFGSNLGYFLQVLGHPAEPDEPDVVPCPDVPVDVRRMLAQLPPRDGESFADYMTRAPFGLHGGPAAPRCGRFVPYSTARACARQPGHPGACYAPVSRGGSSNG